MGLPIIHGASRARRRARGQDFLRDTLGRVVRERLPTAGPDDFLGILIRALNDKFDDQDALALAVDNAATFYLAGHETTANAITWTLFLLAEQPELQAEAAREAEAALARGEADAGLPERLPLLRRILEESMRLYPPAPRFDRQAVAGDRLGDHQVAPGDIVSLWPWIIHRHRALWDDPDVFDPDRWRPEAKAARHRLQYPLSAGVRACASACASPGSRLAVLRIGCALVVHPTPCASEASG